jgi:hypothetical protein
MWHLCVLRLTTHIRLGWRYIIFVLESLVQNKNTPQDPHSRHLLLLCNSAIAVSVCFGVKNWALHNNTNMATGNSASWQRACPWLAFLLEDGHHITSPSWTSQVSRGCTLVSVKKTHESVNVFHGEGLASKTWSLEPKT